MKIFISGQKTFGAAVADMLQKDGHEIVGVCCPLNAERIDPLHQWAREANIRAYDPRFLAASDIPTDTDLIVCAHNHAYISKEIREAARLGAISYHPSLLPRHRGRDAVKWTIKMNDPIAGGTVHWLDDGIDTGPILRQRWCWVEPGMSASDLWRQELYPLGLSLLKSVCEDLHDGHIGLLNSKNTPQNEAVATFEPALNPTKLARAHN